MIGQHDGGSTTYGTVTYDPWGVPTVTGAMRGSLRWKGLHYENGAVIAGQGLYYMRARWYDPEIGRFLSEDPIGIKGGLNQYVFARNDPINGSDPSGTCAYGNPDDPSYAAPGAVVTGNGGQSWVCNCQSYWQTGDHVDCQQAGPMIDCWLEPLGPGCEQPAPFEQSFISGGVVQQGNGPPPTKQQPKSTPKPSMPPRVNCEGLGPMSSTAPNPYNETQTYMGVSAGGMFVRGGDGPWGQLVRHCLTCELNQGTTMNSAHGQCYLAATKRVPLQTLIGLPQAILAAIYVTWTTDSYNSFLYK